MTKEQMIELLVEDFRKENPDEPLRTLSELRMRLARFTIDELELLVGQL